VSGKNKSLDSDQKHIIYIREVFLNKTNSDLQGTRDQIMGCFETIKCNFVPHPGSAILNGTFDGNMDTLNPEFITSIDLFIKNLLCSIKLKTIGNRPILAHELEQCLESYITIFQSDSLPQARTILNATVQIQHGTIIDRCLNLFRDNMDKHLHSENKLTEEEFKSFMNNIIKTIMAEFNNNITIGRSNEIELSRKILIQRMEELSNSYVLYNNTKFNTIFNKFKYVATIYIIIILMQYSIKYCGVYYLLPQFISHKIYVILSIAKFGSLLYIITIFCKTYLCQLVTLLTHLLI